MQFIEEKTADITYQSEKEELVKKMLEQRNKDGKTCFYMAVEQSKTDFIKYFME